MVEKSSLPVFQGYKVEAPGGGVVLHTRVAEGVATGSGGRMFGVDPFDEVLAGDNVCPFHGHAVKVKGRDVTGHEGVGLLPFFLNLVGVEEGESGEGSFEEFRAVGSAFVGADLFEDAVDRVGGGVDVDGVGGRSAVGVVAVDKVVTRIGSGIFSFGGFARQLAEHRHEGGDAGGRPAGAYAECLPLMR